jgi:hypothetical protein
MSSITSKALPAKKKGNEFAKAVQFVRKDSTARCSGAKSKPMTTEEVTFRAFRRTYNRLHPRNA